jgi:hypothetical protein
MSHLFQSLTFESFALDQVEVISLPEDAVLEASTETLEIAVVNVEDVTLHIILFFQSLFRKRKELKEFFRNFDTDTEG